MPTPSTSSPDALQCLTAAGLKPERLPDHIAIIMDGNGRWAQQRGLPRIEGHARGAHSVRATVEECCRLGIGQLTLYCLSSENWKRPQPELDFLMTLLEQYLLEERREILDQNIRFSTIGRRSGLPDAVLREIDENIRLSQDNTGMSLCLAINYGGRTELIDAVRGVAEQVCAGTLPLDAIDEAVIGNALYTAGMADPDLLIRTAGEMRISNFLLWQISYAELWVTERCWPDFDSATLHQALRDYAARERRFGGILTDEQRWIIAMLKTRLWMGAILIALVTCVLLFDPPPCYPFLLLLMVFLAAIGSVELHRLIGAAHGLSAWLSGGAVLIVLLANWPAHLWPGVFGGESWPLVVGAFTAVVLLAFLVEMALFQPSPTEATPSAAGGGTVVIRMALLVWMTAYLGLLPSFLAQLRWIADAQTNKPVAALALAIFVPKCCDIGAYFTGRLLGRHPMSPLLSPKKTWEGLMGGLVLSAVVAVAINRRLSVLQGHDLSAAGFGLAVGGIGALGDLAESLIKRDCRRKDASQVVPGFGGVLDVVDSIVFAAPLAYCWIRW